MLTLRALAIVITGAGVFAALPVTGAQACDDDRYPCPIRVPQETVEAPAQAAPAAAAQPQRKVSHPARANAKPQAKREQEAPRAAARAKPSKPAVQEQAAEPISQKGADAAPAMVALTGLGIDRPHPRQEYVWADADTGNVRQIGTARDVETRILRFDRRTRQLRGHWITPRPCIR